MGAKTTNMGVFVMPMQDDETDDESTERALGRHVKGLLRLLGEDPDRDGLLETPKRFAKALQFFTAGYDRDVSKLFKTFDHGLDPTESKSLVFQAGLPIFSLCEHHMCPFFGVAHIGYIPGKKVIGLSKLGRIADVFARRLQIQERLCSQIATSLFNGIEADGVGVVLQMRHLCMESRGIQKIGTITVTTNLLGVMLTDPTVRSEFNALVMTATQGFRAL